MMVMGCRAAGQASIKALVGVSCLHGHQLLYLHDMGNRCPMRVGGSARAPCSSLVPCPTYQSESESGCARRRLVVRGRDLSWGSLL
jgi:hypothetical protein